MPISQAIQDLEQQRNQIDQVISILRGLEGGTATASRSTSTGGDGRRARTGRRGPSAEGRRRIAEAQRLRWARMRAGQGGAKTQASSSASNGRKAGGQRHMSAEGRRRIAEAQRRRWAKVRAAQRRGARAA